MPLEVPDSSGYISVSFLFLKLEGPVAIRSTGHDQRPRIFLGLNRSEQTPQQGVPPALLAALGEHGDFSPLQTIAVHCLVKQPQLRRTWSADYFYVVWRYKNKLLKGL